MRVTAIATRAGDWWAVEVPEVPGAFTQAATYDDIVEQVKDAVSLMLDVAQDDIEVVVEHAADSAAG